MFELRSTPALPTLYIHQTVPAADLARFFQSSFNILDDHLRSHSYTVARSFYSLCHPLPAGQIECEVGCVMPCALPSHAGLLIGRIPAGVYATGVHRGPYDQVRSCHAALLSWAKSLAYYPRGAAYEWFCRDLQHLPAEIRTDIWLPLQPAPAPAFSLLDERLFQA